MGKIIHIKCKEHWNCEYYSIEIIDIKYKDYIQYNQKLKDGK